MKNIATAICMALVSLLSLSYSTAAQDRKTENAYHSRAKTKIADKHRWIGFDVETEMLKDGTNIWTLKYSVILKYDKADPLIFVDVADEFNKMCFLCTKNRIDIVNTTTNELTTYKNYHTVFDNYHSTGILDYVSRYFIDMGYYLIPMRNKIPIGSNIVTSANKSSTTTFNDTPYTVYHSAKNGISTNFEILTTNTTSFVNDENNFLDSVCTSQHLNNSLYESRTKISNFRFDDETALLNSIFDFSSAVYDNFTKHNGHNLPLSMLRSDNKTMNDDILNFPLVDLYNDTVTIRQCSGWLLLNFWTTSCNPCIKHLQDMGVEKDSLSARILEKEGIRILAIEHRSDNMYIIGKVADKTGSADIIYSAKGIGTVISIPYLGYYYLVSPSKEIVLGSGDCDYSKLLEAKREYERNSKH